MHRSRLALKACTTLLAAVTCTASLAAQNLVQNGSFSSGNFSGWTLGGDTSETYVSGGTAILGATPGAFLFQDIATAAGQDYTLSFTLTHFDSIPNSFSASLGGTVVFNQQNLSQVNDTFSYQVTAGSNLSRLQFSYADASGYFFLNDVSVTLSAVAAVPEPEMVAMLLGGLGIVGGLSRRRRAVTPAPGSASSGLA